jgi:cytoskeletal protein RodZ
VANKPTQPAATLASIGERLKSAREKKALTIDQAQRQTHIHSTVLIALEGGRSDDVLTPTYVKSFLKKYAAYLGLDQNQLVAEYSSIHPEIEQTRVSLGLETGAYRDGPGLDVYVRFARKAVIAVVCIFAAVFLVRMAGHIFKGREKPQLKRSALAAKNVRAVSAKKKQDEKPQLSQITIPQNEQIALNIKVREQVYVGVKRDGVLLFRRLLPKGMTKTVTADEKLDVSIAKAKAVELVLNGRALGPLGQGTIRDLEITRKGVRIK